MKLFLKALLIPIILSFSVASPSLAASTSKKDPCEKNWVFFDLGDTLVDSKAGKNHMMVYLPGATNYLTHLKNLGYQMGLISNIPEDWGTSPESRLARLKKEIQDSWDPNDKEGFHWEWFNESAIFLPAKNAERKPAPDLFHRAMDYVRKTSGCKTVAPYFQSESPEEIASANQLGMRGYLIHPSPDGKVIIYAPIK